MPQPGVEATLVGIRPFAMNLAQVVQLSVSFQTSGVQAARALVLTEKFVLWTSGIAGCFGATIDWDLDE